MIFYKCEDLLNFLQHLLTRATRKGKSMNKTKIVLKALSKTLYDGIRTGSFISDTHNAFENILNPLTYLHN